MKTEEQITKRLEFLEETKTKTEAFLNSLHPTEIELCKEDIQLITVYGKEISILRWVLENES